ncbi:C40 family peptidase [Nocardioides zeae]|uniref:C40 family peptidase n=1 Tax=Nocardioides imazamoxiresistens TaxID=3231893 RepID=A0ABU3Q1A1_9ACTN|nr:C40 family peptidase [Nocardioides zeae]MDT9595284.1 C40 family peptidase [Nocardioides zeae]
MTVKHPALPTQARPVRRALLGAALALAAATTTTAVGMSVEPASAGVSGAAVPAGGALQRTAYEARVDQRGGRVVGHARSLQGTPYRYGGTSTSGFDCSGYVKYVYERVGVNLPRTSSAQRSGTQRILSKDLRAGDLVFFHSGSRVYHVGIYSGRHGYIWHAPGSGDRVKLERVWSSNITFGRVGGA